MREELRKIILENEGDRDDIYSDVVSFLGGQWIKASDILPNYGVPVIVCDGDNKDSIDICRLESKTETKDGVTHDWLQGKTSYDSWYYNVTHWQPLPEPPQD